MCTYGMPSVSINRSYVAHALTQYIDSRRVIPRGYTRDVTVVTMVTGELAVRMLYHTPFSIPPQYLFG